MPAGGDMSVWIQASAHVEGVSSSEPKDMNMLHAVVYDHVGSGECYAKNSAASQTRPAPRGSTQQ